MVFVEKRKGGLNHRPWPDERFRSRPLLGKVGDDIHESARAPNRGVNTLFAFYGLVAQLGRAPDFESGG